LSDGIKAFEQEYGKTPTQQDYGLARVTIILPKHRANPGKPVCRTEDYEREKEILFDEYDVWEETE